ncbi:glycoside hydrolase family 43 protein [Marinoscillum furvescens]|uniref:GH43 family beta-xylosidase n=1 Tax=Marinoscillum furvescens DSM 4134 TaxID=1122208 RepID=A0A3D9L117_MARFU|nr:glycoside hydrolase family 43 protein [Marinoscillum furvescens]RED95268.1 GH43 family beta-xylosidase [Marinoscillum furvescens DSM 4134]
MLRTLMIGLYCSAYFMLSACDEEPVNDVQPKEEPEVKQDSLFLNPILTSGPDPWVFQANDAYYLTFTTGYNLTLYKSDQMADLTNAYNRVVWTPPASGPNSKNIWAPEIHQVAGKWYIYYAADDGDNKNHRMFVLQNTQTDPVVGTWTDKGMLQLPDDKWAIDGTIFEANGQLYYLWSGWEGDVNGRQDIYICKMDDPLTPVGERVMLTKPELSWETNGVSPTVTEGPQVLLRNDKVFIVYSAGGCWTDGYALGLLTADIDADLMSPEAWEKSQTPVFSQYPEGNAYGPGHNGFFQSADGTEDWIIYHANPQAGQGCGSNRSIRIQPFTWDVNGDPDFGTPHPLYKKLTKPSGEY